MIKLDAPPWSKPRNYRRITLILAFLAFASISQINLANAAIAYIPNSQSGNVTVVNTTTQQVTDTITIGATGELYSGALSPDRTQFFATDFSGFVRTILTGTNSVGSPIEIGASAAPESVSFSMDGSRAYVSNYSAGSLTIINTSTNTVSDTISQPCAVDFFPVQSIDSAEGLYFICARQESETASVVRRMNTATLAIEDIATTGDFGLTFAISTEASLLYTADLDGNTVTAVDLNTNSVVATIPGLLGPLGIVMTPDGRKVYVGELYGTNVHIIDTTTNTIAKSLDLGISIAGLGMASTGAVVYAVLGGDGAGIEVIDTATDNVAATIATPNGNIPFAIWGDFLGNVPVVPPGTFAVGGNLSGLDTDEQVTLKNNGTDDLTLTFDGTFTFSTGIADGANYTVSVSNAPSGKSCLVTDGTGKIEGTDVTNVTVTCATQKAGFPWWSFWPAIMKVVQDNTVLQ